MRRRDLRIINLYDKPLLPRPRPRASNSTSSEVGTALLSGVVIVVGTVAFMWSYDAIAHRDHAFIPTIAAEAKPIRRWDVSGEAPKPDMHSPAVTRAEADVPATQGLAQAAIPEPSALAEKKAEPPPKKKVHLVRRSAPGAALGYAAELPFYHPPAPFGGW